MEKQLEVKCLSCKHLVKKYNKFTRYSCPYAPNVERLGNFDNEPLKFNCGGYEKIEKKFLEE